MKGSTELDRRMFLRLSSFVGASGFSGVVSATPGHEPGPKPNELIVGVGVGENRPEQEVEPYLPESASVVHGNGRIGYAVVSLPGDEAATAETHNALSGAITDTGPIKYVEPNETYRAQYHPNDPRYGDQYAATAIGAPTAWEETLGSSDVTIALIDQGVQHDHPDLAPNMAGDPGKDFVDRDSDPVPTDPTKEPHGTHVAGIAGARIGNERGVSGISNSTLLSARVLNDAGWGSVSDIADAVEWAVDQGADIINLSLGGGGRSQTMQNAVTYASSNDVLVVVAAGNRGEEKTTYPAGYDECIGVSALDPDESFATYSNYSNDIELAAPGTNIVSTWPDGYKSATGTSMAAPVVAGVAGLALSRWDLTNEALRRHLKATAVDVGLPKAKQGAGRVDAGAALTTAPGDSSQTDTNSPTTTEVDGSLSAPSPKNHFSYEWGYNSPSTAVLTLSGPSDADFDLYVIDGSETLPTTLQYDYASKSNNSHERITIDEPVASTPLYVTVDAYNGSGNYTLSFEEFE